MGINNQTPEDVAIRRNLTDYPGQASYIPRLPRHRASQLLPDMGRGAEAAGGPPPDLSTMIPSNPVQFHAANQARSNADFAENAPALKPDLAKTMLPGVYNQPGKMSILDEKGNEVSRQGTQPLQSEQDRVDTGMAARGAYVGRQRRLADYLTPGMDQSQFGRDANTRANAESGAGVGAVNAQAGATNASTDLARQMTPGIVDAQKTANTVAAGQAPANIARPGLENARYGEMTEPTVKAAEAAATAGPDHLKLLTEQNKMLSQQIAQGQKERTDLEARVKFLESKLSMPAKIDPLTKKPIPQQPMYGEQPKPGGAAQSEFQHIESQRKPQGGATTQQAGPIRVASRAEVDALPDGAHFIDPSGVERIKAQKPKTQPTTRPTM